MEDTERSTHVVADLSPGVERGDGVIACLNCSCEFAYPVRCERAEGETWLVLMRCPNCGVYNECALCLEALDALERAVDRGADLVALAYERLVGENMAEETARIVAALQADALLPEDF